MLTIVSQYRKIKSHLTEIIKASGYRNDYIAKKMGMRPQQFTMKKQRNNFTDEEIEKILTIINNEDAEDYVLLNIMRGLKEEETVSYNEYKRLVEKWK